MMVVVTDSGGYGGGYGDDVDGDGCGGDGDDGGDDVGGGGD